METAGHCCLHPALPLGGHVCTHPVTKALPPHKAACDHLWAALTVTRVCLGDTITSASTQGPSSASWDPTEQGLPVLQVTALHAPSFWVPPPAPQTRQLKSVTA